METRRSILKPKLLAALVLLLLAVVCISVWLQRWPTVSTATVTYNGQPSSGWRLYRSNNGEFILQLQEPNEFAPYWLVPSKRKVYYANSSNFISVPSGVLVRHADQYGVDLAYTAKSDVIPNVVAGHNFIEFTSLRQQRVRVAW